MSALTIGEVQLVSQQLGRRNLTEVVFRQLRGGCCRLGIITVSPDASEPVRLGGHYHPGTESFVIEEGSVTLYTAPCANPGDTNDVDITVTELSAGQTVEIPAGTVHTFVCTPGTKLLSVAHHELDRYWIVEQKLDIPA